MLSSNQRNADQNNISIFWLQQKKQKQKQKHKHKHQVEEVK